MNEDTFAALKRQNDALESWKAQQLAVHEAAEKRLRPLLKDAPRALGRHIYDVAADEIERLRQALAQAADASPYDSVAERIASRAIGQD